MSPTSGRPSSATRPPRAVRVLLAVGLVLATSVGGPLGAASAASSPALDHAGTSSALQALVLNTQLWVGPNVLVVDLLDAADTRLPVRDLAVTATLTSPDGVSGEPFALKPIQLVAGGPYWSEGDTQLDQVGPWTLDVVADDGARRLAGTAAFRVLPDAGTIPLGEVVPQIDTPTLASSGYNLASITSDAEPEPSFYWTSVRDALDAGRPFVVAIDSLTFRTSDACGGAVAHLRHLQKEFPGLLLIHAEPYVTTFADGALALDPADGPPVPAAWAAGWGIASAPWVLVVDAEGRLRAKLTDVFGSDELRAAVREVAPWAPGGH